MKLYRLHCPDKDTILDHLGPMPLTDCLFWMQLGNKDTFCVQVIDASTGDVFCQNAIPSRQEEDAPTLVIHE